VPCFEETTVQLVSSTYETTEFHYAKRDSANGCYVWVNLIDILAHFSRNFDISVLNITDLNVYTSIF